MKIHGDIISPFVRMCLVTASEAGIRQNVSTIIISSPEYRFKLVQDYYMKLLRRTGSVLELQGWANALASGQTDEQVLAEFLSSPEYFQKAGNTFSSWLDQVYVDVLGRTRGQDSAGFQHALAQGALSIAQVAGMIANSDEYRLNLIAAYFESLLDRQPSADESSTWLHNLQTGTSDEQFAIALLASGEYGSASHLFP